MESFLDNEIKRKKAEEKIFQKIEEVAKYYQENKAVILTETDLQCILYGKLLEIDELSQIESIKKSEQIKTHYVHTEVSWFDGSGKLTIKPDISIFKPSELDISKETKDREFVLNKSSAIVIELKFNRSGSLSSFLKAIEIDIEKIKRLKKENKELISFIVVFDKNEKVKNSISEFESNSDFHFIYKSIDIEYL